MSILTRLRDDTNQFIKNTASNDNDNENNATSGDNAIALQDVTLDDGTNSDVVATSSSLPKKEIDAAEQLRLVSDYSTACLIAVAYSASLGGIG